MSAMFFLSQTAATNPGMAIDSTSAAIIGTMFGAFYAVVRIVEVWAPKVLAKASGKGGGSEARGGRANVDRAILKMDAAVATAVAQHSQLMESGAAMLMAIEKMTAVNINQMEIAKFRHGEMLREIGHLRSHKE